MTAFFSSIRISHTVLLSKHVGRNNVVNLKTFFFSTSSWSKYEKLHILSPLIKRRLNSSAPSTDLSKPQSAGCPDKRQLYALGLYRKPAFPGYYQILQIDDQNIIKFLSYLKTKGINEVAGFLTKEASPEEGSSLQDFEVGGLRRDAGRISDLAKVYETGTLLTIISLIPYSHFLGGQIIVMPQSRVRIVKDGPDVTTKETKTVSSGEDEDSNFSVKPSENMYLTEVDELSLEQKQQQQPAVGVIEAPEKTKISAGNTYRKRKRRNRFSGSFELQNHAARFPYLAPIPNQTRDTNSFKDVLSLGDTNRELQQVAATASREQAKKQAPFRYSYMDNDVDTKKSYTKSDSRGEKQRKSIIPLKRVLVQVYEDDVKLRYDVSDVLKALHLETVATIKELLRSSMFYREHFEQVIKFYNLDSPAKLADLVAGMSLAKREQLQSVLEELDIEKRLFLVLQIVKSDLEFSKIQNKVKHEVEEKMTKEQRKYVLMEQLKFIKRELGLEHDERYVLTRSFEDAVKNKILPSEAQKVFSRELARLNTLDPSSAEFNISRTYLEWLTQIPWGVDSPDNNDISKAKSILNEDHHSLEEVKRRLLEFIAVTILKKEVQGKIICLVGPPGIGKTSVAQSIARALSRKLFKFSLSGLQDVAELRGHRRTYIGAMPGKFVQALRQTETSNPLILLDEVDKLGRDFRGDPASALLEVLDPSQNSTFRDHYLDLTVDLSKVLFICTANSTDTIPAPLLDRMEIIRLAGYILEEKLNIAQFYLLPQLTAATSLTQKQLDVSPQAIVKIIKEYAREPGVRGLNKCLEKIYRKAALAIVEKETEKVSVTPENLDKFLGQPYFTTSRLYPTTPAGVAMGLAWTEMGGATIFVECQGRVVDGRISKTVSEGKFIVTGTLGNTMKESSSIALSFVKRFLRDRVDFSNTFLETAQIHLHIPEGATPKDGPSAGITIATALMSMALDVPIKANVAMTGELSLTGKILRIGGVKEKVIAAQREGVTDIVFPKNNMHEFQQLTETIRSGISAHFVESYEEAFGILFPEVPLLSQKRRNVFNKISSWSMKESQVSMPRSARVRSTIWYKPAVRQKLPSTTST